MDVAALAIQAGVHMADGYISNDEDVQTDSFDENGFNNIPMAQECIVKNASAAEDQFALARYSYSHGQQRTDRLNDEFLTIHDLARQPRSGASAVNMKAKSSTDAHNATRALYVADHDHRPMSQTYRLPEAAEGFQERWRQNTQEHLEFTAKMMNSRTRMDHPWAVHSVPNGMAYRPSGNLNDNALAQSFAQNDRSTQRKWRHGYSQ